MAYARAECRLNMDAPSASPILTSRTIAGRRGPAADTHGHQGTLARSASGAAWQAEPVCPGRVKEASRATRTALTITRLKRTRRTMGKKQDTAEQPHACAAWSWPPSATATIFERQENSTRAAATRCRCTPRRTSAAPSPSALPAPPMRWTTGPPAGRRRRRRRRSPRGRAAQQLQRPICRAPAAGKFAAHTHRAGAARAAATGMLLEGLNVDEAGVLSDARVREERVAEALRCCAPPAMARARAPQGQRRCRRRRRGAESPRLRMSPRASSSGYSTAQILGVA